MATEVNTPPESISTIMQSGREEKELLSELHNIKFPSDEEKKPESRPNQYLEDTVGTNDGESFFKSPPVSEVATDGSSSIPRDPATAMIQNKTGVFEIETLEEEILKDQTVEIDPPKEACSDNELKPSTEEEPEESQRDQRGSLFGSSEEILKQEIPQKMIHEISEKESPEVKAKEKYENAGANEKIEGRNSEESADKAILPFSASGEETTEENLKEEETDGSKPKEVKNLGMEGVRRFDTKCHIERKIAEDMTDDINPDEDRHTQGSRGLPEEIQLKETSEDLVGSSSIPQVSQKETEDENMEKMLSLITEEKSIKEVEREQIRELDMSNLLSVETSRETDTESDDANSTSKLTEASKIGENTNIQISGSAKNEADEAGTICEPLGETHITLPEGEDEKEATSCETPSSALSNQTLQESSAPLIAESKMGTTEVSEMIDDNPDKEVFHINMHNPLTAETTGETLEQNKFEPMDPVNGNLVELIDIPMDSVHAAEKNPESVEPQKLGSSTTLVAKDLSSETFIEAKQTKMHEDNLGAADTNAKEKIFGGNYQECQKERSKEVEPKSEAERQTVSGMERVNSVNSSSMALSEEDSREESLEKVGVHEDDSETTAATMMIAEKSLEEVQPANKSARDLNTTSDENTLEFHNTTIEGEAVSYVELEDFSERCQLTATEYADVYSETMVSEKQATAKTEIEELKISIAYSTSSNVETAKLQVVEDINREPEATTLTKAPYEEIRKGTEKPTNITSSTSKLSEECFRKEMIEEVGNLGDDAETAPATLMNAETGSEGVPLANVSARDFVTTAGDSSVGFHTNLQGELDDNLELLDSSVMSQPTKPEHADIYKETKMLQKAASYETGVEELQVSKAEPNSSEQYVHPIHDSEEISTMTSSEMYTCEEVTIVEAIAEGDKVPNVNYAAGHLIKQFQGPSSATTAEKVEDEIPMEKENLVNELELELVEDKQIDGSGESPMEEPTYLKEATSEEPQEYFSIIQSAESSPGGQEELEDIRHFSSLEPSKEDTLDSAELNKEKELEAVGENENITDVGKTAEDPYRISNREGADNNICSQEADGRNIEEAPIRLDRPETKAPNEENVESHEEPRSASILKVDEQHNGITSVPKKVDIDENSINDEGSLDSTGIKVSEQDSNDVEMEMSNEPAPENKINTREDCIETLKDVIFLKEIERVTVEKSEDINGKICEQDTCTQELQKTTSLHQVLNETTYSDPVPIEILEAKNLSPKMKQDTEKPVNGSRSVLEGSEEDNGEEKNKEAAIVNGTTDAPPATLVSETSSENVQLGEKFMKDSDTENQIEKATEVNETAEDTLVSGMIAEDDEVVESCLGTNSIPIEEIAYLEPVPTEYCEARDLNVETEREKLRIAEYPNRESEESSITKSPEKEAKKGTKKPGDITSSVNDVPAEKSRELKSEADIFHANTATRPGTLVMLLSMDKVQHGEMLKNGSDMKSTDENLNIKMIHTSQEDEEVDSLKLEETFAGKEIVTAENPAKEDEAKEIFSDSVSTSIEQDSKNVLDMDNVNHELTEVPASIGEEVIQDIMATDSIPIQELSEELQRVDLKEKAEEHVTSAGSAVGEFYHESDTKVTTNENLAQETNEEKTINEIPSDLEQQVKGEEPECTQINATTTVPTEEIACSNQVPSGYLEELDLNVDTEREELRDEDLNLESEASSTTKPPEIEEKKGIENPSDITRSVVDVPQDKSRELNSETDILNASTATPRGTAVMELSLEEVQQGETLAKGSDMKSIDENLNIKRTHTCQEDEEVDGIKLEETLSGKDVVFAEKKNANEGEPEETVTSDTLSTSIEQNPKDVLDMDKVQHELTEVPKFKTENTEVTKDFMVTNSIPIQELSEELQGVVAEEKSQEHATGAGMPGSAVVDIYRESIAEGTANENLQETNKEKTVMETPCDLELQETGEELEHMEINEETTVLAEEIAYSDTVPTGYLETTDLNVKTARVVLRGWEEKPSSFTMPPENEEKKGIEKPNDITSSAIDVPEDKSRELKSETDVFNASTATQSGTLVMERSLEEVLQGKTLVKGSDMKSTGENLNIKRTHTSQEDEEVDSIKFEETLSGKDTVFVEKQNANEGEREEIVTSDTISTSIEHDSKDVLDTDKVPHELTEVPKLITENKEVTKDFMVPNSIHIQELSEELQGVDAEEKSKEHATGAGIPGSAVVNIYQESIAEGTATENLQEINKEKTVMETPCDLELQETGEEPEHMEINEETTVLAEEIAYSDTVPTGYLETTDLNVKTAREVLRGWEEKPSSSTMPPEIEEKKGIEKPNDITSSVIDVPEDKSRELKSETDVFNASTATPSGTLVMERSLEEVQQCETLVKGSDMNSTDENLNNKRTHTSQEGEEADSIKLEETLSGKNTVFAEKQNANEGEPEETVTSDTLSTSIEQDPKDVVDMVKVPHELTEVPTFITENNEVTKDFMVRNSIPIQELSEELQKVDTEEKSEEHATGAGMPGSAVVDIYQDSVAEGTANESLAQETNEEKTVMETPCDLELQETGEEPEHMEINAETTIQAEEIANSDTVPTGYLEAIDLNVETAREELRGAEDPNWESKASSITKPPEIEEKEGIEKPVDITSSVIDVPESKDLETENDSFNTSTATPPGTLVMERSLEEDQQGETLIKGSDMKSTDEKVHTKVSHAAQEDEEVDSIKLEETFVVKEIVIAEKAAAHKDEAEEILTSDTASTSIEQNPQDVLDMDNVQHALTEVPGFIVEDEEVTKHFMATNSFPVQKLSEELQRVDMLEKAEELVTGARSAVMDFHQESVAKGTANEHIAQETNEENTVKQTPNDLELQATVEERECIEINAETTVLTEENLEAVEPHDKLLSAHEYVADGQIDEPLLQTNKSYGKDSNDQNLESTIEQEYLEDQSEMNEYVQNRFGEMQGVHETTKDLFLVEKDVVDIQEVEETGHIKGVIMEEACSIQELKRISESDEKTSKRTNSKRIPLDTLEAIGSITGTEEVKLLTSEDLSCNSESPFATDAPEDDKKQGIENRPCDVSSEFEESEKMVKEENMEKAGADNKESENLNNAGANESEVDKSICVNAVSKSNKKVMEDIQRNEEGVTAVSIGVHKTIEAVVEPAKIPELAELATNSTEKFHEPLSEMLPKEQAIETTPTPKNLEDESLHKDANVLNECVEDTLSSRTIDAALLQKETPKGLQVSPPRFELDAVKQNKNPNEAATHEWTVVEEAAAVEPQKDVYKLKIEDSLIPSPTYIPGNAVENFKEDPIQDFHKAEKVLEWTPETRLSAVTKSKSTEIEEEHIKREMTAGKDGELQNKTTLDKEVAKDSLVVSADEEKIRSINHKDELETLLYPEEITSQKLEMRKIATHAEKSDPTTGIEEQTLSESTPVKEVHQEILVDRRVIVIRPEEIKDEKNVKGVPTIINSQEESYETNRGDTNTEDTMITEEVNISEVELLKHVEDQAHPVEKNNLTPNYEAQSTDLEASANKKVGEVEDVFESAQNHPVQEIIEVHEENTNTEKKDNNIPDCLVDAEKAEHTPAESTFDRNISTGSLNQREKEKAKENLATSLKDGTVDLTVDTELALGVKMLAKAYVSMSDKQTMTEADSHESSKPEVSTGSKDDPLNREDLITKTVDAEVEYSRAENDSTPELESNSPDTGEETIMIDEVKEQTEKPESAMISLSELLSSSTKGTSKVAKRLIEESETTDKKGLRGDKVDSDEDKGAKEEEESRENQKADSGSVSPVMVEASRDMDVKVCKKSHGILSGVGSKVKHSISKVKKVITGKSSHPKQSSPNKEIQ